MEIKGQNKHKFFFWLLLKDRLNTKNILRRKIMWLPNYNYVLCVENLEETLAHLFLMSFRSSLLDLHLPRYILWNQLSILMS
jgi:hypothetical protein